MTALPRAGSPRWLAAAPHRLMFFIGASNLLLAMAAWAAWLGAVRWHWFTPPTGPYAGWLHAYVMQYQVLPSFFFGFLLTVFPRWMSLPELPRARYVPFGIGLFGGQLLTLVGASGRTSCLWLGAALTLAGWLWGLGLLGRLLGREQGHTWHARSCFAALAMGLVGLLLAICALAGVVVGAWPWSVKLGTFGLLLPVYFTVAHRMFPFFAGNVVTGYRPWRPLWVLAAFWPLSLAHAFLDASGHAAWRWIVDLPMLALLLLCCWRWWPRARAPALLCVLFVGLAWLPLAWALLAMQAIQIARAMPDTLGLAPVHAMYIGFFGTVLVAMVTRVTQGHAGRALRMTGAAWWALLVVQGVACLRMAAEFRPDPLYWNGIAAIGWLVAFAPWVASIGRIYLLPRSDGKPG